jgi:predicted nucleic acid-binding protein
MRKIGLDTNLIIGMLDEQDVWHTPTVALTTALKARDFEPVVFDCVLSEAISTLARRVHEKRRAVQWIGSSACLSPLTSLIDFSLLLAPPPDRRDLGHSY